MQTTNATTRVRFWVSGLVLAVALLHTTRPVLDAAETEQAQATDESGERREPSTIAGGDDQATPSSIDAESHAGERDVYALVPVSDLGDLGSGTNEGMSQNWMTGTAAILASVAWPLALLIALWRILKVPQIELFLTKLAKDATQINVAGLEIKLSEGAKATLEDLQELIKQVPNTHSEWVTNAHIESQFHHVVSGLSAFLCEANDNFASPFSESDFGELRFTLHVPDVLLAHSMRQLVDYLGSDRGGAGRLFSTRRGIVGLAWRLEESQFEDHKYSQDELVEKWGMTYVEAKDTKSTAKEVLLAFLITSPQGLPLAVLYGDARKSALFDPARSKSRANNATFELLNKHVAQLSVDCGLTNSLLELERARIKVKQLDIYRP